MLFTLNLRLDEVAVLIRNSRNKLIYPPLQAAVIRAGLPVLNKKLQR